MPVKKKTSVKQSKDSQLIDNSYIGARLKALRKEHNISLNSLAKELGMSYSYLWGLENDKHSTSIVNLQKICNYFNVDMICFFCPDPMYTPVQVIHESDAVKYQTSDGLAFHVLSGSARNLEVTRTYQPPHSPAERRTYKHNITGEEFITVLDGVLFVQVNGGEPKCLEAGDSIVFESTMFHSIYTEEEPATFLTVSAPPYNTAPAI